MGKNKFTPLSDLPKKEALEKMVSNLEYKRIENHLLPEPIIGNALIPKVNSFLVAASGSSAGMLYSFIGIRPDKGDVIDEHPIVFYYDYNDPSKNFGGIIHHGNWEGRTIAQEPWQISAMSASGITARFTYKNIPPGASGSLEDLKNNGMLQGLSKQFDVLIKNKP